MQYFIMNKMFAELCTPAKIYFIIAVLSSIFALFLGVKLVVIFMKLVFALLWTYVLGWLCKKGFKAVSWFLVLLPYIIIVLTMIGMTAFAKGSYVAIKSMQMQGVYGQ